MLIGSDWSVSDSRYCLIPLYLYIIELFFLFSNHSETNHDIIKSKKKREENEE